MSPANNLLRGFGGQILSLRWQIAILNRKPFGVTLAVHVAGISIIPQMPQLMDEDVVQIVVPNRRQRPMAFPFFASLQPTATIHPRFVKKRGVWTEREILNDTFLNRIQLQRASPLHSVEGIQRFLTGHDAQLHDIQRFEHRRR